MQCVSFYFEQICQEQRPRGAGGAALVAPKQARGRLKRPTRAVRKKRPPPATSAVTPETAKSPRERALTCSNP
jgi:hypothetical protein